jgi:BirA family transcriptional regulator, biotin operon repressor / biotin---[acetyl-CoA-carboxylase] ligase
MDVYQVQAALNGLPLGDIRYYDRIGSTNDEAARWAAAGAPHLALVVASEQTAGRGRRGRTWFSPPGSSLSFTLVIHPADPHPRFTSRFTALGALSVAASLQKHYDLPARIKWPNDVLVQQFKVCGVLAEASWIGSRLRAVVLGIGINIAPDPIMTATLARSALPLPAASLQDFLHQPVNPLEVLQCALQELISWLPQLASHTFLQAWEDRLAFRNEWVRVEQAGADPQPAVLEGNLLGLSSDGSLRLRTTAGEEIHINTGEVHLRPSSPHKPARLAAETS